MNEQAIIAIANAITANAEVLKLLVESIPKDAKQAVEEKVVKTSVVSPVVEAAPVVAPIAPPALVVAAAPAAPAAPVMPAVPFPAAVAPAPVAAPAPAPVADAPFATIQDLVKWTMDKFKEMGTARGMGIQKILADMGYKNINDIDQPRWGEFVTKVNAL